MDIFVDVHVDGQPWTEDDATILRALEVSLPVPYREPKEFVVGRWLIGMPGKPDPDGYCPLQDFRSFLPNPGELEIINCLGQAAFVPENSPNISTDTPIPRTSRTQSPKRKSRKSKPKKRSWITLVGERLYRVGNHEPVLVSDSEDTVLQAFQKQQTMDGPTLVDTAGFDRALESSESLSRSTTAPLLLQSAFLGKRAVVVTGLLSNPKSRPNNASIRPRSLK